MTSDPEDENEVLVGASCEVTVLDEGTAFLAVSAEACERIRQMLADGRLQLAPGRLQLLSEFRGPGLPEMLASAEGQTAVWRQPLAEFRGVADTDGCPSVDPADRIQAAVDRALEADQEAQDRAGCDDRSPADPGPAPAGKIALCGGTEEVY